MSISSLTNQYVSSSFQNLIQVSSSGEIFDGLGQQITDLTVNASTSTLAVSAAQATTVVVNTVNTNGNHSIVFTDAVMSPGPTTLSIKGDSSSLKYNPSSDLLTVNSISSSYIEFNTVSSVAQPSAGRLSWNNTDGTLDLGMKGGLVTQQIGEELFYPPVVNKSGDILREGTFVMVNPTTPAFGNRLNVTQSITNGTYPADLMVGIITEDIADNGEGFATWFGYVRNLNRTNLETYGIKPVSETWVEGNILYPNPTVPGGLTNVEPTAPALKIRVAAITTVNGSNITILTRPNLLSTLDNLHNVNVVNALYGDLLIKSGSVWIHTKQLSGSYKLTGSLEATSFTGSLFGTSSWAISASNSISSSYTISSSYALSASYVVTASYALNSSGGVTINNGSNNYVLTATGTANTVNGESSLTFDGSTLNVTGSLSNGFTAVATGYGSHAEGLNTTAGGDYSHAEGQATYIDMNGSYAHAEGYNTSVTAAGGHTEGRDTSVSANYAHAEGYGTIANGQYQHVNGTFNVSSTHHGAVIIGNGTGTGTRSNLLFASGSAVEITGSLKVTQGITGSLFGIASLTNSIPTASVDLVTGSLYFDINTNMLYIYNGTSFKSASFF